VAAAQSLALIVAFPLIGAVVDREGGYTTVAFGLAAWCVPGLAYWLVATRSMSGCSAEGNPL
jgi:hypothetical protein